MAGIDQRYERLVESGLALAAELVTSSRLAARRRAGRRVDPRPLRGVGGLGRDGAITEFITTGISAGERAAIGHIPVGRGILGVLIDDARPLRLHDIAEDEGGSDVRRWSQTEPEGEAGPR